jgi:5'-deoxynucleotidase YfbR-like HD superfamily hydrolase
MSREINLIRFVFEQHQRLGCLTRFSNIPRLGAQSVAEHGYSVTFLAMLVGDYLEERGVEVDRLHLLEMALVHDVEEVISGDVLKTLKHGKFRIELDKLNLKNMNYLVRMLGMRGDKYLQAWKEAKECNTLEGRLIHFVDMVDRILYCLKEVHLGNNYFRELLEYEGLKVLDWKENLSELSPLIDALSQYVMKYLAGDTEVFAEVSRAVRIYDYKVGE